MSNEFFNPSGTPAQGSSMVSPNIRAEFAAIAAAFDKLPALAGNAYKIVYINASGSAIVAVGGNGLVKLSTSGIPTIASAGTDYLAPAAIGTTVQAYSANLDEYAGVNPTAAGLALLDDVDAAAQRATLGLAIGTNVQAYDADTAYTDVVQSWTAAQRPATGTASVSTTSDFNYSPATHGQVCTVTLTNAITVTLKVSAGTVVAGTHYTLILKAGDTSARSFAKGSTFLAPGGNLPITSGATTTNAWDVLHLVGVDTNTVAVVGSSADVR